MLKQKFLGLTLIVLSVIITINLFVLSKENISIFLSKPFLSMSQCFSLVGTILLCYSFIMSSKASFLENWFGGLDRIYKIHHITGGISFVLLLCHPMLLIANYFPNKKLAVSFVVLSGNWVNNFGIISLWILVALLVLTIYIKLPYDLWKKLHTYIGLVLLFAALHVLFVKSDTSRFFPLRIWMLSFIFLATTSYLYIEFLYKHIGPKYHYVVDRFNRIGDILEIYLRPITKSLSFIPGQFVFLKFEKQTDSDMHPFSISSDSLNGLVRLSIKIVGDYTLGLRQLKKGMEVKLWGPYGKFPERFFQEKSAVCIAGGIGITPFLGMLSLEAKSANRERNVFLFYCGKNMDELCYHSEIASLSQTCPSIKYISHLSCDKGRLNAKHVLEAVFDFKDKLFFLCGPVLMMRDFKKQLLKVGVNKNDIIFEEFDLK